MSERKVFGSDQDNGPKKYRGFGYEVGKSNFGTATRNIVRSQSFADSLNVAGGRKRNDAGYARAFYVIGEVCGKSRTEVIAAMVAKLDIPENVAGVLWNQAATRFQELTGTAVTGRNATHKIDTSTRVEYDCGTTSYATVPRAVEGPEVSESDNTDAAETEAA